MEALGSSCLMGTESLLVLLKLFENNGDVCTTLGASLMSLNCTTLSLPLFLPWPGAAQ